MRVQRSPLHPSARTSPGHRRWPLHDPQPRVKRGKGFPRRAPPIQVEPEPAAKVEQPAEASALAAAPPPGAAAAAADRPGVPLVSPSAGTEWIYPLSEGERRAQRMCGEVFKKLPAAVIARQLQYQGLCTGCH